MLQIERDVKAVETFAEHFAVDRLDKLRNLKRFVRLARLSGQSSSGEETEENEGGEGLCIELIYQAESQERVGSCRYEDLRITRRQRNGK